MAEHADDDLPPYEVLQVPVPEALRGKDVAEVREIVARAVKERLEGKPPPREPEAEEARSVFIFPHLFNQRYVGDLVKRAVDEVLRKFYRQAPDDSQKKAWRHLSALLEALLDFYGFEMKRISGLKEHLRFMMDRHPEDLIRVYNEGQRKFRFPPLKQRR